MCQERDEEDIFKAAIKLDSAEKQLAYVKEACGDNSDLFARVRRLLKSHNEAVDFLEAPVLGPAVTLDDSPLLGPCTK